MTDSARIGTYDLEIAMIDGTITGELTIKREATGLSATIAAGPNRPAVKSFVPRGRRVPAHRRPRRLHRHLPVHVREGSVKGSFAMSGGLEGRVIGALRR